MFIPRSFIGSPPARSIRRSPGQTHFPIHHFGMLRLVHPGHLLTASSATPPHQRRPSGIDPNNSIFCHSAISTVAIYSQHLRPFRHINGGHLIPLYSLLPMVFFTACWCPFPLGSPHFRVCRFYYPRFVGAPAAVHPGQAARVRCWLLDPLAFLQFLLSRTFRLPINGSSAVFGSSL